MASEQAQSNLRILLDQLKQIDRSQLYSRSAWGEINFEGYKAEIEAGFRLSERLLSLPIQRPPDTVLNEWTPQFQRFFERVRDIDKFELRSIQNDSVDGARNQRGAAAVTAANQLYKGVAQWLPVLMMEQGDGSDTVGEALAKVTKLLSEKQKEMDAIVTAAREAAGVVGAAEFGKDFSDEAKALEGSSGVWLVATLVSVAVLIGTASYLWHYPDPSLDPSQVVQKLSTKIVILVAMLSASIWCGRNYKTLKHLAVVNRHRALSIKTLRSFVAASAEAQTKDAVLLEATRAVFGHVSTGYVDESSGEGETKVIEIARNFLPKPPGG